MIEEIWRIVLDDIVFLPLHHQVIVWAMRDNVDLPVNPLETPIFREARLNYQGLAPSRWLVPLTG